MWTRAETPYLIYSVFTEETSNIHIFTAGGIHIYIVNLPGELFSVYSEIIYFRKTAIVFVTKI